jgi:methylase of polypeptide subunit release factors
MRICEAGLPEGERRALGQYFTRPATVDLVNAFCIREADDVVLDPACGAGAFLVRARARLTRLGRRALHEQLWGFEIAPTPAEVAAKILAPAGARVMVRDAFSVRPTELPTCDAVVGNPPYVARRDLGAEARASIRRAMVEDFGLDRFTQAADLFVYFFVHASAFLREGGRLGFVTSNGWLDHRYGRDLQRFILDHFKIVAVIESRVERSFAQADVNTAITVLERCADADERNGHLVRFVALHAPLHELLGDDPLAGAPALASELMARDALTVTGRVRVHPVIQAEVPREGRWGAVYLRAPDIYFTVLERGGDALVPLRAVAAGALGTKTGCDPFFVRPRDELAALEVEPRFVTPIFKSPQEATSFVLDPEAATSALVLVSQPRSALRGTGAGRYVASGESRNYHRKGECARRARALGRWYDLGPQVQRGRVAFPKTYATRHAVFWNREGCALGARFGSFDPGPGVDEEVLLALLNSSLTALFLETLGRTSLGQGALDFAVYELGSIPVLDPRRLSAATSQRLRRAYRRLIRRAPLPAEQEIGSPEKKALDEIVFETLGLSPGEREALLGGLLGLSRARREKRASVERPG